MNNDEQAAPLQSAMLNEQQPARASTQKTRNLLFATGGIVGMLCAGAHAACHYKSADAGIIIAADAAIGSLSLLLSATYFTSLIGSLNTSANTDAHWKLLDEWISSSHR